MDRQVYGTPAYIAPEVVLRRGYGKPVEWWATGVIFNQFLVSWVPFDDDTPDELFDQVLHGPLEWPPDNEGSFSLPSDVRTLVAQLLEREPSMRLGSLDDAVEVRAHPYFVTRAFDWDAVLRQKAEFVPTLASDEDTSYFDRMLLLTLEASYILVVTNHSCN